jgi:hypothetical protein
MHSNQGVALTHCPWCGGRIVYELFRTGLAWVHDLGNGWTDPLCPDPPVVQRVKQG